MAGTGHDAPASKRASREALLVLAFTIVGGVIRLWKPQHLGLVHFDEGIYALAGLWPFSKGGLTALDPTIIAYAPPGFPVLVGLSYLVFGISDLAAILVSVFVGTLTIPLAAWLARRTFGAGAGAAAAALVAFSGAHVAFSRMALTDVSFLFCWTLGLICAQRFLERPGLLTALALGAGTGLAQLFKYNGWLIGAFVILAALLGIITDANERSRPRLAAVWGYGLLAALVAGVIYWPWFQFVESHGGYASLIAHQRSYMGGPGLWLGHLGVQLRQMMLLSGGPVWGLLGCGAAVSGALALGIKVPSFLRVCSVVVISVLVMVASAYLWLFVLLFYLPVGIRRDCRERTVVAAWLASTLITSLYRPYARLWLPLHLLGWVVIAGAISTVLDRQDGGESTGTRNWRAVEGEVIPLRAGGFWALILILVTINNGSNLLSPRGLPGPLDPSDSLRQEVRTAADDLPKGLEGLRLLVRPPVTFYLGGQTPTKVEPNLAGLLERGHDGRWAIVDASMLRQEADLDAAKGMLLSRWELVREYPTQLNLPTLLDVDPGGATSGRSEAVNAPLWLLRPRTAGTSQ